MIRRWLFAGIGLLLFLPLSLARAQDISINPGTEQGINGFVTGWQGYEKGYVSDDRVAHQGQFSIRCENRTAEDRRGASIRYALNQTDPVPVQIRAWSRAKEVGGLPDGDYSLYVDITYADGTNLWGLVEPFDTGTHDWQQRTLRVNPPKPIREMLVYVLLRNHSGTAWFDDVTVEMLPRGKTFDGQWMVAPTLPESKPEGWLARDVAAGTDVVSPGKLGLSIASSRTGATIQATVTDTTGKDRAITLYYLRRFAPKNAVWWNDIEERFPVEGREWANLTPVRVGAAGGLSIYPFACVTGDGAGLAVGVPATLGPRICRFGYDGRNGYLFAAFDVALTTKGASGKRQASVAVATWKVDPEWGFRDAAAGYAGLFPFAYARRATAEGIWMPFTDPAKVPDPADFGIAYHEGDNSVRSDDTLHILSFRYTEPQSYWMVMPPEVPRTYANALAQLKREAAGLQGEPARQRAARAVLQSGTQNSAGQYNGQFQNAPWANGIVWFLNANPNIPGKDTKALINYTIADADRRYRPGPKGSLDGEYLDSVEAWGDTLDFRPSNLRASTVPLTFTMGDHRPVLPLWFSLYEFVRWIGEDLHGRGRLLFGNSLPIRFFALTPYFDVMGIETNWIDGDKWRPEEESILRLRRTLSGTKPYLLLMNTDFDKMTPERTEAYFQRCMAWGIYPSMFSVNAADSPYWENPKWYDRDRPLFKKYIPVIKRLSAAGWQPVPYVRADAPSVHVERFGTDLFTVRNNAPTETRATLRFERDRLSWPGTRLTLKDLMTGTELTTLDSTAVSEATVTLPPNGVMAIGISPGSQSRPRIKASSSRK